MVNNQLPKFPLFRSLGYTSGALGYGLLDSLLGASLMYFYVSPENSSTVYVAPAVFGLIMLLGRGLDTIVDPLVAWWSDRTNSRRGRRVPFMLFGGVPLILALVFLYFPPVKGLSWINTAYLAGFLTIFFFFFSFYVCPHLALIPELSRTRRERLGLTSFKGVFLLVGSIIATVFWAPLAGKFGYGGMAVIMGIIALVFVYFPVAVVDEKKYCESNICEMDFIKSLFATFKNRPFVIYLIGNITFWFGFNIIRTGVTYYITVLLGLPKEATMNYMAAVFGVTFLFIPVVNYASRAVGKRNMMLILLGMFAVLLPCIAFLNAPWLPVPGPVACYILLGLAGIPLAGLFIVPDAIVADMADYDEMLTGQRREAMYFGAQGFCQKLTLGVSSFLMTVIFQQFGFTAAQPLGVQLTGPLAGFFALIGGAAFLFFPKDIEKKVEQFRLGKENGE